MLWDKILTSKPSFPLFIGSAIVTQLRSDILKRDFDEVLFFFIKFYIHLYINIYIY